MARAIDRCQGWGEPRPKCLSMMFGRVPTDSLSLPAMPLVHMWLPCQTPTPQSTNDDLLYFLVDLDWSHSGIHCVDNSNRFDLDQTSLVHVQLESAAIDGYTCDLRYTVLKLSSCLLTADPT
jgi:hypothetical protein